MTPGSRAAQSTDFAEDSPDGRARARAPGSAVAASHASALLRDCGLARGCEPAAGEPPPALDWARSGAMALTGFADGPPRLAPGPLASRARGALRALRSLVDGPALGALDAPALLGERAAVAGLGRRGRSAPGGSCRLLAAADGWIALNLARPDDRALLPAWIGGDPADAWRSAADGAARRPARELVERARLLGLPAARAVRPPAEAPPWFRVAARGRRARRAPGERPRVVDLSSLWAGPLCGHLLQLAGAEVVKVESRARPDGARAGPAAFFDLLNAGKRSVALDFACPEGRRALRGLMERADIVIESARPRALAQLGIDAEALVARRPGLTWVAISGYGRREPGAHWVGFGDDAAVAAGLAVATGDPGEPIFCGDAIADPLTGLHAALAALAHWRRGGGVLLDLSLRDVTVHALLAPDGGEGARLCAGAAGLAVVQAGVRAPVLAPRARTPGRSARRLGADTATVLTELARAC